MKALEELLADDEGDGHHPKSKQPFTSAQAAAVKAVSHRLKSKLTHMNMGQLRSSSESQVEINIAPYEYEAKLEAKKKEETFQKH